MSFRVERDLTVSVRQAEVRRQALALPQAPWLFAAWMAVAALLAVFAGLTLGILAAMEVSVGGERWTQAVQAHGRLQLFGFAGVFVTALGFEFLIRLFQRPAFPAKVRLGIPALLGVGALLQAGGQVWHEDVWALALVGSVLVIAGSAGFAVAVWQARPRRSLVDDPQPGFFVASAAWLLVAALVSAWGLWRAEVGAVAVAESHAAAELFLHGFILNIVIAIALRAFVGHLGLPPLSARNQLWTLIALNASVAGWLAGQGLGALPEIGWLARVADLLFAAMIFAFTVAFGVMTPLRGGFRARPRYVWLVPAAWVGLLLYAAGLAFAALLPESRALTLYQDGALRHTFLLGFMIPLMIAMAHVVLARFGTGAVRWENGLTAAFFLAMAAWLLRVAPVAPNEPPGDFGKAVMGVAGFVLIAALALVAASSLKTVFGVRRRMAEVRARHGVG